MAQKFLDIQKVIEEWGWTKYDDKPTRKQKQLRDKQTRKSRPYIGVTIDWSECEIVDETVWSPIAEDESKTDKTDSPVKAAADDKSKSDKMGSPLKAAATAKSDVNVLFTTEFTNNTGKEQTYTLKVEKTTNSSATTEVENGLTKGIELGVSLKMPGDVMEMNAGYQREVSLTNTSGETFEEELCWGAESQIIVEAKSIAHAQLVVREKKQTGDFEIVTTLKGYVGVTFTNLRDNNSYLKRADGNISYIFQKFLEKRQADFPFASVDDDEDIVTIRTKGSCKFRYGIKQEVRVDQTKIT